MAADVRNLNLLKKSSSLLLPDTLKIAVNQLIYSDFTFIGQQNNKLGKKQEGEEKLNLCQKIYHGNFS